MKKGGSKRKGSAFEREMCKILSIWWTQDDRPRDNIFWLSSQSGGRATTRAKKGKKTPYSYGDITFLDPIGKPFIDTCLLELKRGYTKDISVLDFLDKKNGIPILIKWYNKAEKERELANRKYTLIIFRRDRHESCIFFEKALFNEITDWCGKFDKKNLVLNTKEAVFMVLKLDDFFVWCNPEFFIRQCKQ